MWLYEHTTGFNAYEKLIFPHMAGWGDVYHRGRYDAFELVVGVRESEV